MAIEVNELRIGNLVLAGNMNQVNFGNGPYKQSVREITLITIDVDDEYMEYIGHVEPGKHNNEVDDLCRNLEPISLNEGWLSKFGFYKDGDEWKATISGRNINITPKLNYRVFAQPTTGVRWGELMHTCPHVHLLQNIVYFATGEELKIK